MTELEFKSLALQGFNRIPLIAEAFADLETPLSLYLKLAGGAVGATGSRYSVLLESVVGGERFGRYSFIGLPARTLLRASGFRSEVVTDGRVVETDEGNPLDFIAAYQQRFRVALRPGLPRFCGGLAGYFGYDAVRYIEPRLAKTTKTGGIAARSSGARDAPPRGRSASRQRRAATPGPGSPVGRPGGERRRRDHRKSVAAGGAGASPPPQRAARRALVTLAGLRAGPSDTAANRIRSPCRPPGPPTLSASFSSSTTTRSPAAWPLRSAPSSRADCAPA